MFLHASNAYLNTVEQLATDKEFMEMINLIGEMKIMSSLIVINKVVEKYHGNIEYKKIKDKLYTSVILMNIFEDS